MGTAVAARYLWKTKKGVMKTSVFFSTCSFAMIFMLLIGGTLQAQNLLDAAVLSRMPNRWDITECCGWTGVWQRRSGTNVFDASWRHTKGTTATDVLEFIQYNSSTREVIIRRASLNGQYKAIYDGTQKTLTGGTATWYPAGATWSARAVEEIPDEKGKVTLPRR